MVYLIHGAEEEKKMKLKYSTMSKTKCLMAETEIPDPCSICANDFTVRRL